MAQQRPLYWRHTGQGAIREGDWKYLRSAGYEYLFNLREDPTESHNLLSMHTARVESLRTQWDEWNESLQRPFTGMLTAEQIKWYTHYFGQPMKDSLIQD
jgi:arylsulfatase A-like enzyme